MSEAVWCKRCGGQLPPGNALGGRCPRCILELGFESAPGNAEELETTISPAPREGPGNTSRPTVLGQYRILRLIGEGGMGAVYEAEQSQPRRTVALKIIKPGISTPELQRRFEQESQALGRLQHPGIAQIYEAGTVDTGFGPQPYFAMELIRGLLPRDYAETHHLNARERLEIMAKICDAVHHAHQRGLIHRDLKPANILIDETGQPKILDFGVARITDNDTQSTIQTNLGQLVGTLAYMSPEQVLADPLEIDTRSDVYSLGVILYEFLSGSLPYKVGMPVHEAAKVIAEEDPSRLSSVSRNFRGDIETIVAKALEKDKTRRYGSAAELSADITRYLRDEPIVARPASATYQLQKFARRHKSFVAGVVSVAAALVGGIAASTWYAIRAKDSEKAALIQLDRAVSAEQRAREAVFRAVAAEQEIPVSMRVAGRVVSRQGRPVGSLPIVLISASRCIPGFGVVETSTTADGAFEFLRMPPGSYHLATMGAAQVQMATVPDSVLVSVVHRDVTGLQFVVPDMADVVGHVVVEGGGDSAVPAIAVSFASSIRMSATSAGGTFRVVLPEGEYRVVTGPLPFGYYLKSIVVGNTDLLHETLKITGFESVEIVVTLLFKEKSTRQ